MSVKCHELGKHHNDLGDWKKFWFSLPCFYCITIKNCYLLTWILNFHCRIWLWMWFVHNLSTYLLCQYLKNEEFEFHLENNSKHNWNYIFIHNLQKMSILFKRNISSKGSSSEFHIRLNSGIFKFCLLHKDKTRTNIYKRKD